MPYIDFAQANEEAERELKADPLAIRLRADEPEFTFKVGIEFRHFVQAILYHPAETEDGEPELQPVNDVLAACMVPGDVERFKTLMASSAAGERIVAREVITKAFEALIDFYRGPRPLEPAEPSSDSPSSTGPDSTPPSSASAGPSKRKSKQAAPTPVPVNPAAVNFVAD